MEEEALEHWRESASGIEPHRHLIGIGSISLSNVAAFSAGPSHEDYLAERSFVDEVRGGVLEAERAKQARREEVQWCRGMGVWEPVLRKDMDAE